MKFFFTGPVCPAGTPMPFRQRHRLLIFLMRVSCTYIVLMILSLQVLLANKGRGQNLDQISVTVGLQNQNLQTLFKEIQIQTGLTFAFSPKDVDNAPMVSLPRATRSVKSTLDIALVGTLLKYEQVEQNVIISTGNTNSALTAGPYAPFSVRGKITNTEGEGIPGVSVFVKGTSRGTTSDADGVYTISVEANDVLVFSSIGFKSKEVAVEARGVIDVGMEEDAKSLQEIVISGGYYETTDRMKTGSIIKVTSKDIETQPITNPLMSLQGRAAGVNITPNTGTAGGAIKIEIRGQSNIRPGGGYPLYIIDGIPVDSRPVESNNRSILLNAGFDPLSTINPANIESIEILKDADATAIYGSRGANGVILITTKKGKESEKTDVDVSFYTGMGEIPQYLDLLNTKQYIQIRKEAYKNAGLAPSGNSARDLLRWDTTRYTNWQKELLSKKAEVIDAQANITGGSKNTQFRLGIGYHQEGMIIPGNFSYKRASGNINVNHTTNNKNFSINLTLNYGLEFNRLPAGNNIMNEALTLPPNAPKLYDSLGNLNWENNTWTNPLANYRKTDNNEGNTIVANSSLNYKIAKPLSVRVNLGYTALTKNSIAKDEPFAAMNPFTINTNTTATSYFQSSQRTSIIVEPQLSYNNTFNNHNLNILLGSSYQQSTNAYQLVKATGYTSDVLLESLLGATATDYERDEDSEYKYAAAFARIGYNYNEKYLLNITGRRDGSSRFGANKRWGNFGAVAAAWIFSNESIIQDVSFISFGKARASYGITGSDQIGDYKYLSTYSYADYKYQGQVSLLPTALTNPNYAWEETKKLEMAIEMAFANDRISVELSLYRNRCSNQLLDYQLPGATGFLGVTENLKATVENKGWEILLNTINISNQEFKWSTSLNITIPKNTLIDYPNLEESPYSNQYEVGKPLNIRKLFNYSGVNPSTGLYEVRDVNNDNTLDEQDMTYIQSIDRRYYGGISNTLTYRGLELSCLFQFSAQQAGLVSYPMAGYDRVNMPVDVYNNYWTKEGDIKKYQKVTRNFQELNLPSYYIATSNASNTSNSFVKLKTITISYNLHDKLLQKLSIKSCKFFVQGQNIYTITKYKALDPETGNSLPPLRILTTGIEFKL